MRRFFRCPTWWTAKHATMPSTPGGLRLPQRDTWQPQDPGQQVLPGYHPWFFCSSWFLIGQEVKCWTYVYIYIQYIYRYIFYCINNNNSNNNNNYIYIQYTDCKVISVASFNPPILKIGGHPASLPMGHVLSFSPPCSGSLRVAYDALAPYFKLRSWDLGACGVAIGQRQKFKEWAGRFLARLILDDFSNIFGWFGHVGQK